MSYSLLTVHKHLLFLLKFCLLETTRAYVYTVKRSHTGYYTNLIVYCYGIIVISIKNSVESFPQYVFSRKWTYGPTLRKHACDFQGCKNDHFQMKKK